MEIGKLSNRDSKVLRRFLEIFPEAKLSHVDDLGATLKLDGETVRASFTALKAAIGARF